LRVRDRAEGHCLALCAGRSEVGTRERQSVFTPVSTAAELFCKQLGTKVVELLEFDNFQLTCASQNFISDLRKCSRSDFNFGFVVNLNFGRGTR